MAATYEPIATTTLGTAAAGINFTGISSAYTDLRLVVVGQAVSGQKYRVYLNSNRTASLYSNIRLTGDGTAASSGRYAGGTDTGWLIGYSGVNTQFNIMTIDLFSYAGSTYKTALASLSNDKNGSGDVSVFVNLFGATTAITAIGFDGDAGANFTVGTTATLYGIKSA